VIARIDEYELITSTARVAELTGVLDREEIRRKVTPPGEALRSVEAILMRAELANPDAIEPVCRDPNDDKLFACAAAAHADYIVSDDNDVLAVGEHSGVRTITTLDFLRALDEVTS
jgi:predicted nucleic acid-binding protein